MNNILFMINVDSYFTVLFELARKVDKERGMTSVLYFPILYPSALRHIEACKKVNLKYLIGFNTENKNTISKNTIYKLYGIISKNSIYSFVNKFRYIQKEIKNANKILSKEDYKLLVLGGDNIGHNTSIFIKQFHKKKIKSIIVPGWMAGPMEAYQSVRYNHANQVKTNPCNYIFSIFNKKYLYTYGGHTVIRWPCGEILAMKIFNLIPPEPWLLNSGSADLILSESNFMHCYMQSINLKSVLSVVTGSVSHDLLYKISLKKQQLKKKLFKNCNFDYNKKLVLIAMPPNMLYGKGRLECEFRDYSSLVEYFIDTVASVNKFNIIISLHPSTQSTEFENIKCSNAFISTESVIELIPLCDLYIASVSATIQWAISCSKPVINYDVYKYKYTDYLNTKGVVNIYTKVGFKTSIKKFTSDKYFLKKYQEQKSESKFYGVLDGYSFERIKSIFKSFIGE